MPITAPRRTPEERDASATASTRHGQELNTSYAARFAGRAMAIVEAFKERGIEWQDRYVFERPTNPLGVQEVMAALGYMAEKLELRG